MPIGGVLRTWRLACGWSQPTAQRAMGWRSSGTISLHENGRTTPDPATVRRYKETYGRTDAELDEALRLLAAGEESAASNPSGHEFTRSNIAEQGT